jgi:hypothetical protein
MTPLRLPLRFRAAVNLPFIIFPRQISKPLGRFCFMNMPFRMSAMVESRTMDPIAARFAQQSVIDAQSRTKNALQKLEDESIRGREANDRFYGSLALFAGGTIALSITYLGYLKSTPNGGVQYPETLIASWIVLMVCVVASLFCTLLNSYYTHFARLRIYVDRLVEQKETFVKEMDNLYIVNLTTSEEKRQETQRFADEAEARRKDRKWAKKREDFASALWTGFAWAARLTFPLGLALLTFFAAKNM